jgi:hypothetical protein
LADALSSSAYVIELIGKLPRREAEALALEIRELAGRHGLKVEGFKVTPVAPEPEPPG